MLYQCCVLSVSKFECPYSVLMRSVSYFVKCVPLIVNGFTVEDAKYIDAHCNWSAAQNWASWWLQPFHLQIVACKLLTHDSSCVGKMSR